MAGGKTPAHQPHSFHWNTGEPMYPWPPSFPCPLPSRVAFPGALLVPLLFLCALCPYCLLLVPHPCPVPRCLPVHVAGSHSLALPPAARGALPPQACSVLSGLPLSAARHWDVRCAPLPTPPVLPCALTLPFLTPSPAGRWCLVQALGDYGDGAGALCAPACRTAQPAGGAPPSPPPPASPH